MRTSIRYSTISRISGAVAGLWLCGGGSAWAGDQDLGFLQPLIGPPDGSSGLCKIFGMGPKSVDPPNPPDPTRPPCPQLPTAAQAVLEIAALGNNLPEMVRAQDNTPPENSITAGNPAVAPPTPSTVSGLLSTLTPLAFVSQSSGTAHPTQLYDPNADAFLYAVAVGAKGPTGLPDPDTVLFLYDDLFRTNTNFAPNTTVAKFSLPLTVLNKDGTERAVPTTLNFVATPAGDCSMSTVVGDFKGDGTTQKPSPAQLGIDCSIVFGASPTGTQKHATFEVAVPLLVTGASPPPNTDPAYFYTALKGKTNPVNTGVFTAFVSGDPGQPANSGNLGPNGVSIGLAPTAAPLCAGDPSTNGVTCPTTAYFALCASLPVNTNGASAQLRPAVGAYYAIATSGETFLTAPFPAAVAAEGLTPPVCPAFP
jgi:hypothetical protein